MTALFTLAAVLIQSAPTEFSGCFTLDSYAAENGTVNTDRLNVRSGPGTGYSIVSVLSAGSSVTINSETTGSDGYIWYQITSGSVSGYARYDYIIKDVTYAASDAAFEAYMNEQGFPESYKNGLRGLHQAYPNWVFTAQHTGLEWSTVLSEESKIGKNLISTSSISSWKSLAQGAFDWAANYWPGFDGSSWVQASEELIAYYLDPRNFLSDPYIFQFEIQNYDASRQTKAGLEALVSGTFLAGEAIVPVEGSVIEGGTLIEGSTYGSSSSSGPSSSSSAVSSTGPGSTSSSSTIGPGGTSSSSGVIISGSASGFVQTSLTNGSTASGLADRLLGTVSAFADSWKHDGSVWYYVTDAGTRLTNGWYWLDGNADGIAECYYFYSDGTMAASTVTPDGYTVDSDGKWTENGVIQTKPASEAYSSGGSDSSSSAQLKKVPYTDIIMYAAESSGVSPYVIASTILQEQGSGTSDLISGTNSTYPGYYNFFNTGAYEHDGMSAVTAGLKYAAEKGWDTIEKSIIGGAENYGTNYVAKGQDTYYLKKFNVQGDNLYNHQYMTHVLAAAAEGAKVSSAYGSEFKNSALTFKIPVYNNMPDYTVLPTKDGNPNNKLSNLTVDGYTITPSFSMDTAEYTLIVDASVSTVHINAVTIDSGASVSGAGTVSLQTGLNTITIRVTAANGDVRDYILSITKKEGDTSSVLVPGSTASSSAAAGPGASSKADSGGETEAGTETGASKSYIIVGQGPQ